MVPFLIYLVLQLGLNCWVHYFVIRKLPIGFGRTLTCIGIWVIPLLGASFALAELPRRPRTPLWQTPEKLPSGFISEKNLPVDAYSEIVFAGSKPYSIRDNFKYRNGLPILDWQHFQLWLNGVDDLHVRQEAILFAQRAWLFALKQTIGPHCYLYESEQAFVLATLEPNVIVASAQFIVKTRKNIARILPDVACFPDKFKSILLVFDDEAGYQRYSSIFSHTNEGRVQSSGMFIAQDCCPHFITKQDDLLLVEPIITHELTHSALAWLDIPLWLNEGLAVTLERRLHSRYLTRKLNAEELLDDLRNFWDEWQIQEFWSGTSFHRNDEGTKLSYELAHILVENLAHQLQEFLRFIHAANKQDGGAKAAKEILSLDLGAMICQLIDVNVTGEWSPQVAVPN
ncbi:hypothetical protein ACO0LF_02730 [Undibacterium sp. Di27W]|uniref:hypothetical protein n=1 Tax=Undibacterium sp. Di27W TaxID=3413036 RepID=UPI003BF04A84